MTVIAYRDGVLASDRQMVSGSTAQQVTKIHRRDNCLLGVTGNLSIGMEMIDWFARGAVPSEFPASNRGLDEGSCLIVVSGAGVVRKYESTPYAFIVEGPFCAFGCGDEAALVAMACGKSAEEAVLLACRYNTGCGGGVDVLRLRGA